VARRRVEVGGEAEKGGVAVEVGGRVGGVGEESPEEVVEGGPRPPTRGVPHEKGGGGGALEEGPEGWEERPGGPKTRGQKC
jgi:hypothetical protein